MYSTEESFESKTSRYIGVTYLTHISFKPSFYTTMEFHKWWADYYNQQIFDVAGLSHELTTTFSSTQERFKKALSRRQNVKDHVANTRKPSTPSKDKNTCEDSSKTNQSKLVNTRKPPPTLKKRKASSESITIESDGEDQSPPHTKLVIKKRQKAIIPLVQEKESGTSKPTTSSDKKSSDEQPLKTVGNTPVFESHNSSPDNILSKDDASTATSNLKTIILRMTPPYLIILQEFGMEDNPQLSNIDEGDEQSAGSEGADPSDENKIRDEASSQLESEKENNQPFGKVTLHENVSTNTPPLCSPAELENLKDINPASFPKAMMSARSSSSRKGGISSTASGGKLQNRLARVFFAG
ncbi:uncharacterized protein LOC131620081 [Vicia villosa]|uniref:uncharacterized protein LOC131620081 n=1 Tax=Vicia villosa TaxID=3911 RepID=UPI00273C8FC7|nr:uncharacterized protein LOC131620081 [Vicia villosa]